jgi:hypothetical protein
MTGENKTLTPTAETAVPWYDAVFCDDAVGIRRKTGYHRRWLAKFLCEAAL